MRPLEGLRVVDLTRVLSGPFCTMQLGDLGAEVIKVERPIEGDDTRAFAPPYQGNEAAYFLSVNRNKKRDRKSTRLNSSQTVISYAVFCLKKKKKTKKPGNINHKEKNLKTKRLSTRTH